MSFRGAGHVKYGLSDIKTERTLFEKIPVKRRVFWFLSQNRNKLKYCYPKGYRKWFGKKNLGKITAFKLNFFLEKIQKAKVK